MLLLSLLCACGSGSSSVSKESDDKNLDAQKQEDQPVNETDDLEKAEESSALPQWTTAQKNVMASAKSYLSYTGFSYSGLIEQLEFEKYSHEDAVWAADNCNADWNEEALESAKSYIDYSGFSYNGIVEQLEFEGFTSEQAIYGADNCGADWNN